MTDRKPTCVACKGAGGVDYTAGTGIVIENNEISADTSVLATKTELPDMSDYQEKLTAGSGITIDANNIISATGSGDNWIKVTSLDAFVTIYDSATHTFLKDTKIILGGYSSSTDLDKYGYGYFYLYSEFNAGDKGSYKSFNLISDRIVNNKMVVFYCSVSIGALLSSTSTLPTLGVYFYAIDNTNNTFECGGSVSHLLSLNDTTGRLTVEIYYKP